MIEAIGAIARLGLPVKLVGVVGATENLPSGRAVKPGDIVTAASGKTIEVNNTDAEGRLVLADCLHHAVSLGAERVVDLATLTGAVIVALGSTYAGLLSSDDEFAERVAAAGERSGEIVWRLPLHAEYDELIKGRYGDLNNAPEERKAGTIVGAAFLSNFVEETPWAHLDIAGSAWTSAAPTPRRAPRATACACSSSWHAPTPRRAGACRRMDFDLSPDHELIRRTVREFAEGEVAPVAEELDRTKAFPYDIVAQLGKLNLMGIPFPQEYGGAGADTLAYALAVEELTRVDSSVAITLCAHTSLGTQPIYLFGSEQQKREWLPQLCAGAKLGAFGLTEPEAGSDAGNTRTHARLRTANG